MKDKAAVAQSKPLTRQQRRKAKLAEAAAKRRAQSVADATAAGVSFVRSVSVCGYCGHENVLAGTRRKKGGTQCWDVRRTDGAEKGQSRGKRAQPASSAPATPAQPVRKVDQARQERQEGRKAQLDTDKLRAQQRLSGSKPAAAVRVTSKAASADPDPFAGSLFLKFQKQVRHHLRRHAQLARTAHAPHHFL